jgi:hypothetical protein
LRLTQKAPDMKKEKEKFILFKMMAMMTVPCQEMGHRISESFDRKLTFRERVSIRIHNLGCAMCERYYQQMKLLHKLLGNYAERVHEHDDPSTKLSDKAKEKIVESLKKEMS